MAASAVRTDAESVGAASRRDTPVVVGLPTRNEAATVRQVVAVIVEGLRRAGVRGHAVLVNAETAAGTGHLSSSPRLRATAIG